MTTDSGTTHAILATTPLSLGRRGHTANILETGEVLLAGFDQSGQPVALIEIYTP